MLTSNDDLRSLLRTKCRNNIARPAIGNKKFWIRSGHELYERDPYDPRLIKAIIIEVFGTVNEDVCTRCGEGKGPFMQCTSIKTWVEGCCSNCKKFDCCSQCSLTSSFKTQEKLAEQMTKGQEKVDAVTRSGRNTQKPAKYGL
jgi:hypothetical protein